MVYDGETKGSADPNPFADPAPQPSPQSSSSAGLLPVRVITRTFEPKGTDEIAVEIGDEVSVSRLFDDGWGKVKVLRRNGSTRGVQGLEGLVPIDCLRPKGSRDSLFVGTAL